MSTAKWDNNVQSNHVKMGGVFISELYSFKLSEYSHEYEPLS